MGADSNQTVELFSGPKIFSSIAEVLGYDTFTVDRNSNSKPDLVAEIPMLQASELPSQPLVVWAALPDGGFNVADYGLHWDEVGYPKTEVAETAIAVLRATLGIIGDLKPQWWFIENPYGPLRHFATMSGFNRGYPTRNRVTIDHSRYGENPSFLTDVWTNAFWWQPRYEAISRLARRPVEEPPQAVGEMSRRLPAPAIAELLGQLDSYRRNAGAGGEFSPPELNG